MFFSVAINILVPIYVLVCFLMIVVVLMQKPKSEGLGAAFGGGMMEQFAGAQATNVLAKATRFLGGSFFVLTLLLSILYAKQSMQKSTIQENAIRAAALATPAPAPTASPAAMTSATGAALTGTNGLGANAFDNIHVTGPAASPGGPLQPPTLGETPASNSQPGLPAAKPSAKPVGQ